MNTKILERIGFTQGEIKVYSALLETGNTTSGPVINKSGVARSKVYEIIEKLKIKGLVSESIKSGTRYFQAASPDRILDYIKNKEKELKKEASEFKQILPELVAKQKFAEEKQEVKVYVGFEGVKTFYDEILDKLNKGDEYLAMTFSNESLDNKSIILMFQKFHQKRAEKKAKAKILCNIHDKLTQKKMNYSNTRLYEFKTTKQTLPTGIAIVKDTVATFNWGKIPRVFVIICRENAEQYRKFFYDVWNKSD
ncbi:hypothetical protein KY343_06585 [Candidatus Woesearchaeota archaeon]|nr:hypothetical protein [Candidatus Woesearchaeota archaeon]